ncbi:D-alanyl-D-alanine dipeptidase [Rouxiella chamberiensis]|uniref:D-alanyl-D-alanine dipeptidase n=1 Tax=Rouxiella chamberiensis TaxID=1513468 RepID=A0ABY7HQX2_9GAMM|nr:D-alanyl-D-alanine dipeptidase [Rouxiella chamberiensis]WAT01790.1 D-alanyl-D-alanine dipeptidase [Rouxiella chamberiensis]
MNEQVTKDSPELTQASDSPDITLIDVAKLLPQVVIDMKYATDDNLTGRKVYCENRCLLHPDAASALTRCFEVAQLAGFNLKIFDAYRPQQAQHIFWAVLPNPDYVADIKVGSHHSRGVAVDLTLLDEQGVELDMGAGFDEMTERSHPFYPHLPADIQRNRLLLIAVMAAGGFIGMPTEWWHFELPNSIAYPLLNDVFDCY